MNAGLNRIFGQLQDAGGELADGQLLARFLATRDESAFAVLVRRHGAMVLGVCRRILHDVHDAEDAFQACFLILARKAASVTRRESIGCWLHTVAHNTAVEAARANARRRARERQVKDMPHPTVAAVEPSCESVDWRPVLDHELGRLSEKCRAAVVLCDLEGRSQRQAARHLGISLSTLASRLARGRQLLAKRLKDRGVVVSASAMAALLVADAARAQVPAALTMSTARVATLVAAGQMAAGSTPAVLLMKGVMQMMLVKKLRLALGAIMFAAALGAVGFASRSGDQARAQEVVQVPLVKGDTFQVDTKPVSELEALRKEVALLRINNNVLLEKIGNLEAQLGQAHGPTVTWTNDRVISLDRVQAVDLAKTLRWTIKSLEYSGAPATTADLAKEVEAALKVFVDAKTPEEKRRAAATLEQVTQKLKDQVSPEGSAPQAK